MITELNTILPNFPGPSNCSRCFLHVVNLIAKQLLKLFDVQGKDAEGALDAVEEELLRLAAGIDLKEMTTIAEGRNKGDQEIDDVDSLVDKTASLTADEHAALQEEVAPVRLVLIKLWKFAFKVIHSTTKLLPAWYRCLKEQRPKLSQRLMLHNITTRWNSTFDMLDFALEY
ncbi:hypothetical protein JAAARDRAFT_127421 [Jaapia argillacea MUCL 33604]|uniref:hAT-like transposase RNase-H fold domain-containing protein n=1 Tax=Jaapia argillacea MUCL 33604 TaxID=933084 RepID=A0A067Q5W5_9AGAM|nr:hypothetical protein JAAARDRAFT_127421 [Jaapia argillacea MUCL 33604]